MLCHASITRKSNTKAEKLGWNLTSLIPVTRWRPEIDVAKECFNEEEDDGWSTLDYDCFAVYGRPANDNSHDHESEVARKDMTGA
jgi:hypothetical protein